MRDTEEIHKLKKNIFSADWEGKKASANRLFEIGGQENTDYLISLLDQSNSQVRDAVALTFRERKFNEALDPLLKAIVKKENSGYNGTMVYALETLDCSHKLKDLFEILFEKNSYEAQNHILTILNEQTFEFSSSDLLTIKAKWDALKERWNVLNNIEGENLRKHDIDKDLIQSFVDSYTSYFDKK